jgi:hypothetical protein
MALQPGGGRPYQVTAIGFEVPAELENSRLAQLGVVDVTAKPFQADPTGKRDSTEALQKAIDFARDHLMVTFFPTGTYRVSGTLSAVKPGGGPWGLNVWAWSRMTASVLVGDAKARPRIVLTQHSPGFGDPGHPKYVVHFWSRSGEKPESSQSDVNINQMLVGIDITVGEGNPGAIAIGHNCAQGCGVQDSTIDVTHGLTGIAGGAGSGGSHAGVTVIGGKIGLDLRETQNAPTIVGITLIGQTQTAILTDSLQSLTAVGVKIVSRAHGPMVVSSTADSVCHRGQICLIDSELAFEAPGAANTAISSWRSVYLNNVYVKNAAKVMSNPDGAQLAGNPKGWMRIGEYAHGVRPPLHQGKYQFEAPVYLDGVRSTTDALTKVELGAAPPAGLQARHLWPRDFPTWQSPGAVSVKAAPYNAKGDGTADDSASIQRAIDEHDTVLLPKGQYRITRTIRLRPGTRLVGVAQHLSLLVVRDASGDFADPTRSRPIIETADDAQARTVLAFCGLNVPKEVLGVDAINWRAGRNSIVRSVLFANRPLTNDKGAPRNAPLARISGHGGGRWYNYYAEYSTNQAPGYRHMLVDGTSEPLSFYQANPEHARGEANMEIRNARYVSIYGLKGEGNQPILWVRDSDHIRVFGYGGNAAAYEGTALFRIERTPNFLIANAVDQPRLPGKGSDNFFAGRGVDPNQWYMITDNPGSESAIKVRPLDRPVLYRRGRPRVE